jgi:homoserine dehydrogenase
MKVSATVQPQKALFSDGAFCIQYAIGNTMKKIPVIMFGAGGVGRSLLQQIVASRPVVAARNQLHFELVAVADSRSWRWQPAGLSDEQIGQIVAAKTAGQLLGEEERPSLTGILHQAAAAGIEQAIVVDVTAEDGLEAVIDTALDLGYSLALANKKPFAGPWATAQAYFNQPRIRYESTVGGGQPVIATLRYLLDVNDPPLAIAGQLSGTLGFICGQLDEGMPFSQALALAKANGYTEPDPREDLGGKDVMRKIMILGRMAGWPLEEADIAVESLYPAELAQLSVDEFMAAIQQVDPLMQQRVEAARAEQMVLRHTALLSQTQQRVGLTALPQTDPLANLKYISFRTRHFHDQPLFIGGKGASVAITAYGVLGDMIGLVRGQ